MSVDLAAKSASLAVVQIKRQVEGRGQQPTWTEPKIDGG